MEKFRFTEIEQLNQPGKVWTGTPQGTIAYGTSIAGTFEVYLQTSKTELTWYRWIELKELAMSLGIITYSKANSDSLMRKLEGYTWSMLTGETTPMLNNPVAPRAETNKEDYKALINFGKY